jgi:phosphate transport system substrate-binding protein
MRVATWMRPMRFVTVALAILALVGTGCSKKNNEPNARPDLSGLTGSVVVDGSSTVFPITQAVAEEFGKKATGVKVSVGTSGTGGGFKKFCKGETDISDASRPIKDSEIKACKTGKVNWGQLTIAIDGLSVVTNTANTFVDCLTTAELKKIWEPGSTVKNWSQVRAGFPNKPLKLYGPGTDSGTFDYFTEVINGKAQASRSDFTPSEDDNVLVTGISGDAGGLGYFGFAYFEENAQKLRLLGVDSGSGCVKPSTDTINGGTYKPLSRPLFIYIHREALKKPQVVAFLDFYMANVNKLVADVGYIDVPAAQLATETTKWTSFKDGYGPTAP